MTLLGLDRQREAFDAAIASGRMHHAWLFAGPRGVGKARFADAMLERLLPGEQAAKLIAAGSHPDVWRLERLENEKTGNLARNVTVDQVRGLRGVFATASAMGGRRVVIVDAVDDMERGAANALLKSLEEPPVGTIFLLISHAPGRLLPTIRSRCQTLTFGTLPDAVIAQILDAEVPDLSSSARDAAVAAAGGSAAAAIAFAEQDVASNDAALATIAATGDPTNAARAALAQSLATKAATPRYEAFLKRAPVFIAAQARGRDGAALSDAIDRWARAAEIAGKAIAQSLPADAVVFELAGCVAALAGKAGGTKGSSHAGRPLLHHHRDQLSQRTPAYGPCL